MKQVLFITAILFLSMSFVSANDRYQEAMNQSLQMMEEAKDENTFLAAANQFSRIAEAEKSAWLPFYYCSYNYIVTSFVCKDEDQKDGYLDLAQDALDAAMEITENESALSELYALQGYLYMAKISISPMVRGMMYGPKAGKSLEKAIELDATNPRPHFLLGENTYYTPSMFGGGESKAKPHFEQAAVLFENRGEAAQFLPTWGAERNTSYLEKYN